MALWRAGERTAGPTERQREGLRLLGEGGQWRRKQWWGASCQLSMPFGVCHRPPRLSHSKQNASRSPHLCPAHSPQLTLPFWVNDGILTPRTLCHNPSGIPVSACLMPLHWPLCLCLPHTPPRSPSLDRSPRPTLLRPIPALDLGLSHICSTRQCMRRGLAGRALILAWTFPLQGKVKGQCLVPRFVGICST